MLCQPGRVVMLRRHGHRKACGHGSTRGRSLMQAGPEEAAWKRQGPAARRPLIAVQRERRPSATARQLIARRLSLARTRSEPAARKRQETAAHEILIVLRRERRRRTANQPLIGRERSLARIVCRTTAPRLRESTEPAVSRLVSAELLPGTRR